MKFLPAPWRWEFISGTCEGKKECFFCDSLKGEEKGSLTCFRGKKFFVIMNKYPYNSGHIMIAPKQHLSSPDQISPKETQEMWELMQKSMQILKDNFHPDGFNMGMNLGSAAGAGVKDHFHLHIVPRWTGDANFMVVTGKTKVVSYDIKTVYDILYKGLNHE